MPDLEAELPLPSGRQGQPAFLLGTWCKEVPRLLGKVRLQVQQERESVPFAFTGWYKVQKRNKDALYDKSSERRLLSYSPIAENVCFSLCSFFPLQLNLLSVSP